MSGNRDPDPAMNQVDLTRHLGGFATSGAIAFTVDATILALLTKGFGVDPLLARLAAIAVAMVAGWQAHRRLTFAVKAPSSLREFMSYAAVAWASAAINYMAYAAVLLLRPETEPLAALVIASLIAMTVSYIGMRFGVFGKPGSR